MENVPNHFVSFLDGCCTGYGLNKSLSSVSHERTGQYLGTR